MQGRSVITGVIQGTPAQQAGLLAGDVIVFAYGAPFQPVQSFRDKIGKEVVLACVVPARLCKYRLPQSILNPTKCSWTA